MSRFKDGRILTAFRLSPEQRVKLQALSDYYGEPKAAIVRKQIDKDYDRLEKQKRKAV